MRTSMLALTAALAITFSTHALVQADAARADIERVQQALKAHGHDPGPIDGVVGPQTTAALKAYQKQEGLEPTGRADGATLARLGAATSPAAGPRPSPSSTQTGGDTKPSAVDPKQATETGANVGEGAAYSRSTEKGLSKAGDDAKK